MINSKHLSKGCLMFDTTTIDTEDFVAACLETTDTHPDVALDEHGEFQTRQSSTTVSSDLWVWIRPCGYGGALGSAKDEGCWDCHMTDAEIVEESYCNDPDELDRLRALCTTGLDEMSEHRRHIAVDADGNLSQGVHS